MRIRRGSCFGLRLHRVIRGSSHLAILMASRGAGWSTSALSSANLSVISRLMAKWMMGVHVIPPDTNEPAGFRAERTTDVATMAYRLQSLLQFWPVLFATAYFQVRFNFWKILGLATVVFMLGLEVYFQKRAPVMRTGGYVAMAVFFIPLLQRRLKFGSTAFMACFIGGNSCMRFALRLTRVLLMAAAPAMLFLAVRDPRILFLASAAVYATARGTGLNLPSWPGHNGWYFNPFAWQFMFSAGVGCAARRVAPPMRSTHRRPLWPARCGTAPGPPPRPGSRPTTQRFGLMALAAPRRDADTPARSSRSYV